MVDLDGWIAALEERHLANLTRPELTRALRALSSCYVERRGRLAEGAALEGAGKRAAFALFYGPLHFVTVSAIVEALGPVEQAARRIVDLGCGTGVGGAAWAVAAGARPTIAGIDRNAWAVREANWTYRTLGLNGRATVGDVARLDAASVSPRTAVLLAYAVNELPVETRATLLDRVAAAVSSGSPLLVVEPIARSVTTWWGAWVARLSPFGARENEWRFPATLPRLVKDIARGAGLDPRDLTARSLFVAGR